MNTIIRLLYVSRMQSNLPDSEIDSILTASRASNSQQNITGVLCCKGGYFLQILEGPEDDVLALYMKIKRDRRHHHCFLISISAANQRLFGNWSMGFLGKDSAPLFNPADLLNARSQLDPGGEVIKVMKGLLGKLECA